MSQQALNLADGIVPQILQFRGSAPKFGHVTTGMTIDDAAHFAIPFRDRRSCHHPCGDQEKGENAGAEKKETGTGLHGVQGTGRERVFSAPSGSSDRSRERRKRIA